MKTTRIMAAAVLIVGSAVVLHLASAQQPGIKRTDLQRHDLGSLGHRSGARYSRRRGLLCATAWADHGGDDRAGTGACSNKLSTRAGENSPHL